MVAYIEIVDTLVAIEHACDVNSVKYKDIKIWPLVRLAIYEQLRFPDRNYLTRLITPTPIKASRYQLTSETKSNLAKFKGVDLYFNSFAFENSELRDGRYWNPWIDTVLVPARNFGYSCIKVEVEPPVNLPRHECTVFAIPSADDKLFRAPEGEIENFNNLASAVSSICDIELQHDKFLLTILEVLSWQEYYAAIIKIIRPKTIILENYYCPMGMALCQAAFKYSVPTIDVQHGGIEELHGMYTHWATAPSEGYEFLPEFIWCWTPSTAHSINRWFAGRSTRHHALVGGHPRLLHHLGTPRPEIDPKSLQFFESLQKKDVVILVSLDGNPGHEEPDFLFDVIRDSPSTWLWLLRLHPVFKGKEIETNLLNRLKSNNISNFDIENATNLPLLSLLEHCDHHVTGASSTIFEALGMGVPSTMIHPHALESFTTAIKQGLFAYASSSSELVDRLLKCKSQGPVTPSESYAKNQQSFKFAIETCVHSKNLFEEKADLLRIRATTMYERREYEIALNLLNQAQSLDPFSGVGMSDMAAVYWELNNLKSAEEKIKAALDLDFDNSEIQQNAAVILGNKIKP